MSDEPIGAPEQSTLPHLVTVSVVSHGHISSGFVPKLLDDLSRLGSAKDLVVILTLNRSDEVIDVGGWKNLHIIVLRNPVPLGFGKNHNQAFQHCRTPWFFVVNPDIELVDDPVAAILSYAGPLENVGAIAPAILSPAGAREDSVRVNMTPLSVLSRVALKRRDLVNVEGDINKGRRFIWLAGMFLAFPATAYRRVGGFDERYFLYCEDYDICARLVLAGLRLHVAPRATAIHSAHRASHSSYSHLKLHLASAAKVWVSTAYWRILVRRWRT